MNVEELMKPRYKVIADYPFRDHFLINEVIELNEFDSRSHLSLQEWFVNTKRIDGTGVPTCWYESTFEKYPHLFRKLQWWEERTIGEMPEYVKFVMPYHKAKKGEIKKVDRYEGNGFYTGKTESYLFGKEVMPSTQSEYTEYINSLKQNT